MIKKYIEFINEEITNDTPESNISIVLKQLKMKIDKMFEYQENMTDDDSVNIIDQGFTDRKKEKGIQQAKDDSKDKSKISFKDLGVKLESNEISVYSKMNDSLTVKFSDDMFTYTLYISINLKEAIPDDINHEFQLDDIKTCYIKFKKYDLDTFEVIGQLTKNVNIKDIDEDFLVDLKIECDEKNPSEQEEFKIETE
jgi:hypothetical protein